MNSTHKSAETKFIVLEVLLGIVLSFVFIILIWNNDNFWGSAYFSGIIRLYGISSLIFFFAVFLVGIIGANKLNQSNRIGKAIFYSILYWLLSLIGAVILANFLYILSLYFILAGIVVGFNHGLRYDSQKWTNNSN